MPSYLTQIIGNTFGKASANTITPEITGRTFSLESNHIAPFAFSEEISIRAGREETIPKPLETVSKHTTAISETASSTSLKPVISQEERPSAETRETIMRITEKEANPVSENAVMPASDESTWTRVHARQQFSEENIILKKEQVPERPTNDEGNHIRYLNEDDGIVDGPAYRTIPKTLIGLFRDLPGLEKQVLSPGEVPIKKVHAKESVPLTQEHPLAEILPAIPAQGSERPITGSTEILPNRPEYPQVLAPPMHQTKITIGRITVEVIQPQGEKAIPPEKEKVIYRSAPQERVRSSDSSLKIKYGLGQL